MANLRNVSTWLDRILLLTQQKIAETDELLPKTAVAISLTEELLRPPGVDRYLLLVPGPQRPIQGLITGGGNRSPLKEGQIGVILWTRLYLDAGHIGDEQLLTNVSLGSLDLFRRILASLQLFDPKTGTNDYYLAEPMREADGGWLPRRPKGPADWAPVSASVKFEYLADLSMSSP